MTSPPRRTFRNLWVDFDNDAKVRAPFGAQGLIERVNRLLFRDRLLSRCDLFRVRREPRRPLQFVPIK